MDSWYALKDAGSVDSPALLVYPDRIVQNIERLIAMAGEPAKLRPHVKTHKMTEVVALHLERGVTKFKCATIAEAEMLARAGAADILLAYQPVGPKLARWTELVSVYPDRKFSTIADCEEVIRALSARGEENQVQMTVFLDIDNGMSRTGIAVGEHALELYRLISSLPGVRPGGFHAYDGHVHDSELSRRREHCDQAFGLVEDFRQQAQVSGLEVPVIVTSGTPTFPFHVSRDGVELSPGTYVFWDAGSETGYPDIPFDVAAVLLARVISKPGDGLLCVDIGHKAIAAENPLERRVRFLNARAESYLGHNEEHLVIRSPDADRLKVGDPIYAVPWHICPTVALHDEALVVENGEVSARWKVAARTRKINF